MVKVAIHKQWEYVLHNECLNSGDFNTNEFKVCKEDMKSPFVDGRKCVHCKALISQKQQEVRKSIVSKMKKPVATQI